MKKSHKKQLNRTERRKVSWFGFCPISLILINYYSPAFTREITIIGKLWASATTTQIWPQLPWYGIFHSEAQRAQFREGLEWNAGGEESFNDWRFWDQPLQSQVEYSLESLLTEWPQHLELVQNATEVVRFLLSVLVVSHMVSQGIYNLGLQIFNLFRFQQSMALYKIPGLL